MGICLPSLKQKVYLAAYPGNGLDGVVGGVEWFRDSYWGFMGTDNHLAPNEHLNECMDTQECAEFIGLQCTDINKIPLYWSYFALLSCLIV